MKPRTYADYLRLGELLGLQGDSSGDQLHFVVTHQAMELWFKLVIDDLRRARDYIEVLDWIHALAALRRLNATISCVIVQMATLSELSPPAFAGFRHTLGSASGLQSSQFRLIEVLAGLRTPQFLRIVRAVAGSAEPGPIDAALEEKCLAEVVESSARKEGVDDWCDVYLTPERYGLLAAVAEALVDFDALWLRWRTEHVLTLERVIGPGTRGTGGKTAGYLDGTFRYRFFPFLWEAREALMRNGS